MVSGRGTGAHKWAVGGHSAGSCVFILVEF